jgi:CRISPR-associated endonuclease/helicase Cas3
MLPDAAPAEEEARETEGFGYRLETYEEHIFLVYGQFQDVIWPELALSAARLERKFGWPTDSLYKAARLAVLLHDTGKLNVEWQRWVVEWQREIGLVDKLTPGEAYAHTDNHTREHWEKAKAFRLKRSPHAVQSAAAVLPILIDHLKDVRDLLCAAFSAISRHHAPHSSEFQPFQLEPEAAQRTLRILQRHAPELNVKAVIFLDTAIQRKLAGEGIGDVLIAPKPDEEAAFLAYILIARALRRADQRGTGMGTQK